MVGERDVYKRQTYGDLYPLNAYTGWTRDNYGLVWTDIVATNGLITHITLTSCLLYTSAFTAFTISAYMPIGEEPVGKPNTNGFSAVGWKALIVSTT